MQCPFFCAGSLESIFKIAVYRIVAQRSRQTFLISPTVVALCKKTVFT
jgi:hypothetical protein